MLFKKKRKKRTERFFFQFLFGIHCITKINLKFKNIYYFGSKINQKRESGQKII